MRLGFQVDGQMTESMEQPLKWVRKSLGLNKDVEDGVRGIMKAKEDSLTGPEVRHNRSSPIIAFTLLVGKFHAKAVPEKADK